MDLTSLYTVIPIDEGLRPLKHFFDHRIVKEPSSETLLCLAELVLTYNCFSFGGDYYKQTNDVAMGTKMGPSYASLFVGFIEHQFFSQYHGPKHLFILSFPLTKVSGPSNIFSIIALLRNLALKHYSVWPN